MKIFYVFLDIDGVLNDSTYWYQCRDRNGHSKYMNMQNYPFNPTSLTNLFLLSKTLLKHRSIMRIVLSSTWRLDKESTAIVNSRLAEYGLTIYDKTPQLNTLPINKLFSLRSCEIKKWLEDNKNPTKFLILDDADVTDTFEDKNIIHTDERFGFNIEKLTEAQKKVEEQYGKKTTSSGEKF